MGTEIAGLSRREFLMALFHAKVEACQVDIAELKELESWKRLSEESSTPLS
jgi:hypothetical protein